jgi:hypothetical protein
MANIESPIRLLTSAATADPRRLANEPWSRGQLSRIANCARIIAA